MFSLMIQILFSILARGLGVKVKGRVEKQDCNEQWVQKGDASQGLTEQRQVRGGQQRKGLKVSSVRGGKDALQEVFTTVMVSAKLDLVFFPDSSFSSTYNFGVLFHVLHVPSLVKFYLIIIIIRMYQPAKVAINVWVMKL